jgi:hypothetical protein
MVSHQPWQRNSVPATSASCVNGHLLTPTTARFSPVPRGFWGAGDPLGGGRGLHALAGQAGADRDRDGQVCLAGAGGWWSHFSSGGGSRRGGRRLAARGEPRDVELAVLAWSTDDFGGEVVLLCRLVDGSSVRFPRRGRRPRRVDTHRMTCAREPRPSFDTRSAVPPCGPHPCSGRPGSLGHCR